MQQCGYIGYISYDNIHEINTWKCPIQTQCGYIGYTFHDNIHERNTWKCSGGGAKGALPPPLSTQTYTGRPKLKP